MPGAGQDFRLRAIQRMRMRSDFDRPRSEGLTFHHKGFVCRILTTRVNAALPLRRLGVIASKRTGKALDRNRARRLLRETFRLNQHALPDRCDVFLIARKDIHDCTLQTLEADFRADCARAVKRICNQ